MDVPRFHVGDVENVRDNNIARVAKNKIGNEVRRANTGNCRRAGEEMRGRHIACVQRIEPRQRLLGCAFNAAFAFVFGVE